MTLETIGLNPPKYWNSWKGRVIRNVVVNGVYSKDDLLKATGLDLNQLETALTELVHLELLNHNQDYSRFWSNSSELSKEYREFYERRQISIIDELYEWKNKKWKNSELTHFFIEDDLLDELAEKLIKQANIEVLVINPFVERCHLSNSLILAISNGVRVRLVTHSPEFDRYNQQKREKYHSKLKEKGVSITYDNSVHAKLIVIDRAIAIVSSMNFIASSSGGASYEAGLVTVERRVVESVYRSIIDRLMA